MPVIRQPISVAERQSMASLYLKGSNIVQIGKMFNCSANCVARHLKIAGVSCRPTTESHKRYTVNNDYFSTIDSPTKAYLLGMIYSDGNVFAGRRFKLALWDIDEPFLKDVAKELGFNGPLYREPRRGQKRRDTIALTIYGRPFVRHLKEKGVIENKTNQLVFPTFLSPELNIHFIHGLFDGDGCITLYKCRGYQCQKVEFSGCYNVMVGVRDWFLSQGVEGHLRHNKHNPLSGTVCYSSAKALKAANLIYKNHQPLHLSRKWSKYCEMVGLFETRRAIKWGSTIPFIDEGLEIIRRYSS